LKTHSHSNQNICAIGLTGDVMISDEDLNQIRTFINKAIDNKCVKQVTYTVERSDNTMTNFEWKIINNPQYRIIELKANDQTFNLRILM